MMIWDNEEINSLYLFSLNEYKELPYGTELESIFGHKKIVGKDEISLDIRGNYIAYGVRDPFNHQLKDLFLTFQLKQ